MARARSAMDASFGDTGGASEILSFPSDQEDRLRHGPAATADALPSADDWRAAVADVLARLDASEQRTLAALGQLRRRVDGLDTDITGIRGGMDGRISALEREVVALGERIERLEDRALHRGRRR